MDHAANSLTSHFQLIEGMKIICSTDSLMFTKEAGVHIGFLNNLPVWGAAIVLIGTLETLAAV